MPRFARPQADLDPARLTARGIWDDVNLALLPLARRIAVVEQGAAEIAAELAAPPEGDVWERERSAEATSLIATTNRHANPFGAYTTALVIAVKGARALAAAWRAELAGHAPKEIRLPSPDRFYVQKPGGGVERDPGVILGGRSRAKTTKRSAAGRAAA